MGKKNSKPKPPKNNKNNPEQNSATKEKRYMIDPVFGRMVFNRIVGAWVPAANEDMYEQSHLSYLNSKKENEKYLKTFNINPENIKNFYQDENQHQSLTLVKKIPIKKEVYSSACFLNDGRLAINWDYQLKIYSKDFETIEQKISTKSIFITQLKDGRLVNTKYNTADIYKYDATENKFILDYGLKCINSGKKVVELSNDRLAFLADDIAIYVKEEGKYVQNGKNLSITTIDDFISLNDNEIVSISGQESTLTFWDLTTRNITAQIGDIESFGRACLLLFDKTLIVAGANKKFYSGAVKYIYVINVDNKELIKKYSFYENIWCTIKLNDKEFITGETNGIINKYRLEDNEVKLMEKNEEHGKEIVSELAFSKDNNHLASLSEHQFIIYKISE